jgi:signal transduction histidine kinase
VTSADLVIDGSYDYRIVALAIVIALLGSYTALDLAERLTAARGRAKVAWLVGGATAQSIGIWAVHYTGMLSFRLPIPMSYDWPTALLSFLPAFLAALAALWIVSRLHVGVRRILAGGVFIGAGIIGLHYTAMASMRFYGTCRYSPAIVMLSAVFAIGFALLSLWLTFLFRDGSAGRRARRIGSALLLGAAICLMHYTAMEAATFTRSNTIPDLSHAISVSYLGIAGIGGIAIVVLGLAAVTSIVDHKQRLVLQRSFEQLRALAARLQSIREEERTRVAREIHDELGQALTSIKIDVASLIQELPPNQHEPVKRAESILKLADETIQSVRRLATELRPGILDDLGLVAAVEWATEEFQARTGIKCRVSVPDADIKMDSEPSTALFRILQETLTNVARHADATEVEVRLTRVIGGLSLETYDNGIGFDEGKLRPGSSLGLLGMRERALLLGGELTIRSASDGTTVKVRIPDALRHIEDVTQ